MRFRLVTVTILLAVASSGDGRPRDPDPLDGGIAAEPAATLAMAVAAAATPADGPRSGLPPDSRNEKHRETKDIQSMDQSLRRVATQLLNSTSKYDDIVRIPEEKIVTIETPMQVVHISTRVEDTVSQNNKDEGETVNMKFGIPVNSKFGHFEISNPGHAMAMTEEEIEREMATAMTIAHKPQPTTTSMLSTWIQLYPPVTTTEGHNVSDVKTDVQNQQLHITTTKQPLTAVKQNAAGTKPVRKNESKATASPIEKSTKPSVSTTKFIKNENTASNYIKMSPTSASALNDNDVDEVAAKEKKTQDQRTTIPAPTTTKQASVTKKAAAKPNSTPKLKVTTPKNPVSKPSKPNNSSNRVKHFPTRRPPTNKNETVTSTSKIEKVTFKPMTVAANRTENTEKPMFITKIKASLVTDALKSTTTSSTTMKSINNILSKSNFSNVDSSTKLPTPTRVNNVLKVHMKKPIDDATKIEIQPIRVNPPVLTIEKIEDISSDQKSDSDQDILENSKIDVKFDFNPEYTKVNVQTLTPESTSVSTTTTKRPRLSNKRKKNKHRRRKPSTTTTTTMATPSYSLSNNDDTSVIDVVTDELITGLQESKIEPESKAPPSKKKKPNPQNQVQKPIGTQIYNFLSREVMPSVGVMSLVGLGLGLASYFLYPFGGVIARRNYDVEPNYKYNLDEYGGNYGLSEEEVLTKVYSGMTGGQHHETKYNPVVGEKNSNYYRYSGVDQAQPQSATRYPVLTMKNHGNRVIYRPVETTSYDSSYRNTEFKYPDVPTTPNYYERQRLQQTTDFAAVVGKSGIGNNRQFVVGNIPKEYSSIEADKPQAIMPMQDKVDLNLPYQTEETFINDKAAAATPMASSTLENLGSPTTLVSKVGGKQPSEVYEDVEITPTAVAIEHGPRSLRSMRDPAKVEHIISKAIRQKRSILPDIAGSIIPLAIPRFKAARSERSSVIQVIPSKSEIEMERKQVEREEDLSNEILDIIDEAIPVKFDHQKKRHGAQFELTVNKAGNKLQFKDSDYSKNAIKSSTSNSFSSSTPSTVKTSSEHIKQETITPPTVSTTSTATTSSQNSSTEEDTTYQQETTIHWDEGTTTTEKPKVPKPGGIDIFGIAKRIAEIKLRLGLTILKHASEGFARYIGQIQKRFNGEE